MSHKLDQIMAQMSPDSNHFMSVVIGSVSISPSDNNWVIAAWWLTSVNATMSGHQSGHWTPGDKEISRKQLTLFYTQMVNVILNKLNWTSKVLAQLL